MNVFADDNFSKNCVHVGTFGTKICGNKKIDQSPIFSFLGIKYATAKRWKSPVPYHYQQGTTVNAFSYGAICPQANSKEMQSEDCLFLNITTPAIQPPKKLPVLIFIHGGGFSIGSGSSPLYEGTNLVRNGNQIVVTFNYRLGALGFLKGNRLGDCNNCGLQDQVMALKWVKKHISSFGGDPDNITIFGESAGAMSVGIHLQQQQSQSLFKNAIIESNPYGLAYKTPTQAKLISDTFFRLLKKKCADCSNNWKYEAKFQDIVALQDDSIIAAQNISFGLSGLLPWLPYVDGIWLTSQPVQEKINKPVIIGTNTDEGVMFASVLSIAKIDNSTAYEAILSILFGTKNGTKILTKINSKGESRYAVTDDQKAEFAFANVLNDYLFTCPNRYVLQNAITDTKYGYSYNHILSYNFWEGLLVTAKEINSVYHTAELPIVFGNATDRNQTRHEFNDDEKNLTQWMQNTWTAFALNQNPNLADEINPTEENDPWVPFSETNAKRLIITAETDRKLSSNEEGKMNCAFWDSIGYGKKL